MTEVCVWVAVILQCVTYQIKTLTCTMYTLKLKYINYISVKINFKKETK